jgi:S-formylglutathione hydrolase FrmB
VVLPVDAPPEIAPNMPSTFKALYLLHGYSGNHLDWLCNAPLSDLSAKYGLAFIMPAGENSFYLNDAIRGALYEDFVCEELPAFCRRFFPLSEEAKNTVIGGLSMGGFGALHSGFAHPEIFGNIIALSSALITDEIAGMKKGQSNQIASYDYYHHTFGPLEHLLGNHNDPKSLAAKLVEKKREIPNIYMACGTEDSLIKENRGFHCYLQELGIPHEYVEGPGIHDWTFWNAYLVNALIWLDTILHA